MGVVEDHLSPQTVFDLLQQSHNAGAKAHALFAPGRNPASYQDLVLQVRKTAATLNRLGVSSSDRVATVLPNGPEMVSVFLGITAVAGCAPLNPAYRASDFEFYLADLRPKLLIVNSNLDSPVREVAHKLGIEILELNTCPTCEAGVLKLSDEAGVLDFMPAGGDDVALLLHTSGTTSRPKLVPLTHKNVCTSARNIAASLALTPDDRCLNVMPLFHIHGLIGAVLSSLSVGSSVVCTPGFVATKFFEWLREFQPTWYSAVPTMHQAILARAADNEPAIRESRLRFIRSCSAALPPTVMAATEKMFGVPVVEAYGMTEASHQMAINPLPPRARKPGSVGLATGADVAIMDNLGNLLPAAKTGELVVRGSSITRGYESNAEANAKSFTNGWFRTGDEGYIDSDGYIFLTGRIKELINRGGEKISPREIDDLLLAHPAIAQALAFAIPDAKLGEEVGAAVVLKPGQKATELEIQEYVAQKTADFKVPHRVVFLEKLPTGPTGKPQRIGLAKVLGLDEQAAENVPRSVAAPRNETEAKLAEVWREVLGTKQLSTDDDFFVAGGDSLLAAQLIGRIRRRFGVELTMPRLFALPTIGKLSEWISQQHSNAQLTQQAIVRVGRSGEIPLSFPQQRMWFASQIAGESPVYNRAFAVRLRGPLDVFRIQQCLTAVVDRHEILRTTYKLRDGVPVQVVGNSRPVPISLVDLTRQPEACRLDLAADWARDEMRRPFNLASDHMLRVGLAKLGTDDHVLLFVSHHIAFDATSQAPFLRDIAEAYQGISKAPLQIDYADFASWQVTQGSDKLEEMQEWWKQELRDLPQAQSLTTDFSRPARQSYRGGTVSVTYSPEDSARVMEVARELGATPFIVLLAAYSALTSRYSGLKEMVVGTPTSGRILAETEEIVGLFVNLLVLRTRVDANSSFRDLVNQVRTTTVAALEHQEFPFEKLVEALAPERSLSQSPLFQVMFEYRNHPSAELKIDGIAAESFEFETGHSQYDLHFDIRPDKSGMDVSLHYNGDLFRRESAERIVTDFRAILASAVANPGTKVSELECPGASVKRATAVHEQVEEQSHAETGIPRQKRSSGDSYRLSFAQERLWFLHQLEPDNATYNIPVWLKLTGDLDIEALRKSLEFVLERHESLRTVFESRDGAPVQVVQRLPKFELPVSEAGGLSQTELHDLARKEILRPFDLAKDAMLRSALYRVNPETHYLLVVVHHIAADGWSMPILQQELGAAYRAYALGQEPNLPPLPIQYADFADWQREFLTGKVFEEQLDFWTRQLKGAPNNPLLLTDRPRGARQTYNGERYIVPMSAEFEAELNRFNRKERVTLFMTILAGLETLLHRMTGQADIVVGAPIANRTRMEVEPLIGFFVNTLALRCDFSDDPTFLDVLNRIRENTLESYQNQDLPFEKLVQALQPERSLSHTPVFQVILAVQNTPDEITDFGPLSAVQEDIDERVAKFDVSIFVEFKPRLRIVYNFNTDLFEQETVVRFAEHFENLVRDAMASPEKKVSQLGMMSSEESQLLLTWGRNSRPYPSKAVHEIFEEVVERSPNSIAIVAGEKEYSYRELNERANQLARELHKVGIGPGKRVGILMRRSFETIASMLATLKLGAAYVPLDKDYPAQRIGFLSSDCELAAVLTTPDMVDRVPAGQQIVRADEAVSNSNESLKIKVSPNQAAYVIYTSGSTGQPKGVEVPHRGIVRLVFAQEYAQFGSSETTLQLAPLSFDASTLEVWAPLLHGGTCVLFSGSRIDAEQVGAAVKEHHVSTLWLTSSLFNSIVDESPEALAPVRQLLAGGEALSVPHVRRAFKALKNTQLINGYGPTENTTFSCCHRIDAETLQLRSSIPIGKPIANTDAFILDKRMEIAPTGVPGELFLGGDGLALGYVNRPELTDQKFVSVKLADGELHRLYRTGDICRWLNDGTIEFLGRSDEQVKIRGFRIELGEIETAIAGNDAVNSVAVLVTGEGANKRLVAYVVTKTGSETTGPKLREYLRQSLPDYMIPAQYVFLQALPVSKNGKIDKAALPEPTGSPAQEQLVEPHDSIESRLKAIWENVLGVAPIGVDQDFFELGGHSLLATKLLARVERTFGVKLPITSIFQYSTIVEFSPLLRNKVAFTTPAGVSKPPLIWVGGGTFLRPIAKWLQPERALSSVLLDADEWGGLKKPYRLEEVASILAKRILKQHPNGPYHLAGWCYEGLLAYETAQQLRAQGANVGLLVLVDAATPLSRKPFAGTGEVIARVQRLAFHLSRLARMSPSRWLEYLRERFQEFSKRITRSKWQNSYREGDSVPSADDEVSQRILHLAISSYVPKPYLGSLLFFQAAERPHGKYWDLAWEWKELTADRCDCREISGDHVTILKAPNIDLLGEHLKSALDATPGQPDKRSLVDMTFA